MTSVKNWLDNGAHAGGAVGVVGSGGALPDGAWYSSWVTGFGVEVLSITTNGAGQRIFKYRLTLNNTSGGALYPQIAMGKVGSPYRGSLVNPATQYIFAGWGRQVAAVDNGGGLGGYFSIAEYDNTGAYLGDLSYAVWGSSNVWTQLQTPAANTRAGTNEVSVNITYEVLNGHNLNVDIEVAEFQLETGSIIHTFIPTTAGPLTAETADVNRTLAAMTASMTSSATTTRVADFNKSLGNLSAVASGALSVTAVFNKVLGSLSLLAGQSSFYPPLPYGGGVYGENAAVQPGIIGTFSKTLGSLDISADGMNANTANLAKSLGPLTVGSTGGISISGVFNKALDALTTAGSGVLSVAANLSKVLDGIQLVASSGLPVTATLAQTLGNLTVSAATNVFARTANAAFTLGQLTASSVSVLVTSAFFTKTLGSLTAVGQGRGALFRRWVGLFRSGR